MSDLVSGMYGGGGVATDTTPSRSSALSAVSVAHAPSRQQTIGTPPRLAGRMRGAPRPPRRLYHAEQVMEQRKLPKKKYLATQRLRRDLERSSVESLKLDVNFLRQEIANLCTVREIVQAQRLTAHVDAACSLMAMVAQYHATTKHGIGREPPNAPLSTHDKVAFLRSIIDPHVRVGSTATVRSLDAFIEQWLAYTHCHAHLAVGPAKLHELQPLEGDGALPVIVSNYKVRVRVSRRTLESMFPHVLRDEALTQQLNGREIVYPCETRFYFSTARMVVRHDTDLDFVSGLNDVLQSLRVVNEIMDHAQLDGCAIRFAPGSSSLLQQLVATPECPSNDDDAPAERAATNDDDGGDQDGAYAATRDLDVHSAVTSRMSITMLLS